MYEIRVHGRGGQGVVTAAEMLSVAAFREGRHAQAFPSFGSERMGAPVVAFCRIDDKPIRLREPVTEPDALIIADPTLLHQVDVFGGLRPKGIVLVNSSRSLDELGIGEHLRRFPSVVALTVAAGEIARRHLGRPMPNAALLGGFAAVDGPVSLDSVHSAIRAAFSAAIAEPNVAAATDAFEVVRHEQEELAHA